MWELNKYQVMMKVQKVDAALIKYVCLLLGPSPHPFKAPYCHPPLLPTCPHQSGGDLLASDMEWPSMTTAWAHCLEPPLIYEMLIFFFALVFFRYLNHITKQENVMTFMCVKRSWPCLSVCVILDKNNLAFNYNNVCQERGQLWKPSFSNNAILF